MKNLLKRPLWLAVLAILISNYFYQCGPSANNTNGKTIRITAGDSCGTPSDEPTVEKMLQVIEDHPQTIGRKAIFICRGDLEKMLEDPTCEGVFAAYGLESADAAKLTPMAWQAMHDHGPPNLYYLVADLYGCYCKPCCDAHDSITVGGAE